MVWVGELGRNTYVHTYIHIHVGAARVFQDIYTHLNSPLLATFYTWSFIDYIPVTALPYRDYIPVTALPYRDYIPVTALPYRDYIPLTALPYRSH